MEARMGGEMQLFNKSLEWDPNDWKWDGDLFIARPKIPSSNYQFFPLETGNSSSSFSDEVIIGEFEKRSRRRENDENVEYDSASLSLKLGEQGGHPREFGKRTKLNTTSNRAMCQVDDCGVDLSNAKDYHRRHKVCEMHSKSSRALVSNLMQRFCQQCSRFHALEEFDEGKRSCRRRLAGHNKRRRKTQADSAYNNKTLNDVQASGYSLMSLLKILSNMHSNRANHIEDQDLLSHLLRSLASQGIPHRDNNLSGLLQASSNLLNNRSPSRNSDIVSLVSNGSRRPPIPKEQHFATTLAAQVPQISSDVHDVRLEDVQTESCQSPGTSFPIQNSSPDYAQARESSAGRRKLINFDLNDVYDGSDDSRENLERLPLPADRGIGPLECRSWLQQDSQQSSPPSRNSDSSSTQSPSSSSSDAQSRTDRIVFKLFGKDPSDFPYVLRAQILDWLSHSPSEIESYIRPGCIVLTVYLRLPESAWDELCCDLSSTLSRLLDVPGDSFWRKGWIYIRVQNQIAFVDDGKLLLDVPLPFETIEYTSILSVKPIAVPVSDRAQFLVKGYNLTKPSTRLLCALEGNYLVTEANDEVEHVDGVKKNAELQSINLTCSIPAVSGRGFIEVEDHGLSNGFFPIIIAEEDVCSEIRMLESAIELTTADYVNGLTNNVEVKSQAMDFIHEMGWLLHRNNLKARLGNSNAILFPLKRFKWLMEFSIDHDWCAVVRKLLNLLLGGTVGGEESSFLKVSLSEMGLLHKAVRRNSRPLVELLLTYTPEEVADELCSEYQSLVGVNGKFLFRPDSVGPAGLTPLHVAAGIDGYEDVLDSLTDDPGMVAIEAWKNTRDSAGFTPEDYARLRGHYSYIHLVQRKINRVTAKYIVVDIPNNLSDGNSNQKDECATASFEVSQTERRIIQPCGMCDRKLVYGRQSRSLLYRPVMFSMVALAAVCVCVALLFKSSPEVLYIFRPFRWEMLDYGSS